MSSPAPALWTDDFPGIGPSSSSPPQPEPEITTPTPAPQRLPGVPSPPQPEPEITTPTPAPQRLPGVPSPPQPEPEITTPTPAPQRLPGVPSPPQPEPEITTPTPAPQRLPGVSSPPQPEPEITTPTPAPQRLPGVSSPPPVTSPASAPTQYPKVKSPSRSTYPPPPPTTARPPPRPSISITPSPAPGGRSSSGISKGLVFGIAIGSVVTLAALTVVLLIWNKKRKRRPQPTPPPPPLEPRPTAQPYDYLFDNRQQSAPAPGRPDHFSTIPPEHSPPPVGPVGPPRTFSSRTGSGSHHIDPETPARQTSPRIAIGFSTSSFTYEELSRATDGFSTDNYLGKGGFGYVYRGALPNGQEIAVKQLKTGSVQGEREFQAEVEIISRVHHKHLVSLVGYCITGSERMLAYEFVQNNTLQFHLHGKGRPTMDWSTRLKIALGAARGVAYLHEDCHPKIIHRDIEASNILLDSNFEAKVADFGLAKFNPDGDTHISTRVLGTFGCLAPEYAISGKLTEKFDIFSFGVVLLELITGRLPIPVDTIQTCMDDSLVGWAGPLLTRALEDGNFDALVDPRLQMDYRQNEMARIVACAAACVRFSAKLRPPISQVVRALEGNLPLSDLNEGIKPGHSTIYSSVNYDTAKYNEDMKKFRKLVLPTGDSGTNSQQ